MITKREGSTPNKVLVTFQLPAFIWAESVHIAGDFNGWNTGSHALAHSQDGGHWEITLELERGRAYQFRYLVDGTQWQNDWSADRYLPNSFGGDNSVVET